MAVVVKRNSFSRIEYECNKRTNIIKNLFNIFRTFDNPLEIVYGLLKKDTRIKVKHGRMVSHLPKTDLIFLAKKGISGFCSIDGEILTVKKDDISARFCGWRNNGDIISIFINGEYDFLPVKDETVIDIGGNIGDSSIYFSLRGAKRVISLEPYPKNYKIAERNIRLNNLNNVDLLLAGCSSKNGQTTINPDIEDTGHGLEECSQGIKIPTITLEQLLEKYPADSFVLKMDCEGSEHEIILFSDEKVLRKFSHIQIEYHGEHQSIASKLRKAGFDVSISEPVRTFQPYGSTYNGFIYAIRQP